MAQDELSLKTQALFDKQGEKQRAESAVKFHRDNLSTAIGFDFNARGDIAEYKAAYDKLQVIEKEIQHLIGEVVTAYPAEMIWAAKNLQKPLALRITQAGFYALIPPKPDSLSKDFTFGLVPK